MTTFDLGETVICSITVKDSSGTLQDPATSMNIVIDRISPNFLNIISSTAMTNNAGDGAYHYDFDTSSMVVGDYKITYIATDGTRITKHTDTFKLI